MLNCLKIVFTRSLHSNVMLKLVMFYYWLQSKWLGFVEGQASITFHHNWNQKRGSMEPLEAHPRSSTDFHCNIGVILSCGGFVLYVHMKLGPLIHAYMHTLIAFVHKDVHICLSRSVHLSYVCTCYVNNFMRISWVVRWSSILNVLYNNLLYFVWKDQDKNSTVSAINSWSIKCTV